MWLMASQHSWNTYGDGRVLLHQNLFFFFRLSKHFQVLVLLFILLSGCSYRCRIYIRLKSIRVHVPLRGLNILLWASGPRWRWGWRPLRTWDSRRHWELWWLRGPAACSRISGRSIGAAGRTRTRSPEPGKTEQRRRGVNVNRSIHQSRTAL